MDVLVLTDGIHILTVAICNSNPEETNIIALIPNPLFSQTMTMTLKPVLFKLGTEWVLHSSCK